VIKVRGPEDALRALQMVEVGYESTARMTARTACLSALKRVASSEQAREAFVDACYETGTLV
jgi:hypothetical protein